MLTETDFYQADQILIIDNVGPALSQRRDIFDSCERLISGHVKRPEEYRKSKEKKYGKDIFGVWYTHAYETFPERTCAADWFDKTDRIVSKKLGYLSMGEIRVESMKRWELRQKFLDSLENRD